MIQILRVEHENLWGRDLLPWTCTPGSKDGEMRAQEEEVVTGLGLGGRRLEGVLILS